MPRTQSDRIEDVLTEKKAEMPLSVIVQSATYSWKDVSLVESCILSGDVQSSSILSFKTICSLCVFSSKFDLRFCYFDIYFYHSPSSALVIFAINTLWWLNQVFASTLCCQFFLIYFARRCDCLNSRVDLSKRWDITVNI